MCFLFSLKSNIMSATPFKGESAFPQRFFVKRGSALHLYFLRFFPEINFTGRSYSYPIIKNYLINALQTEGIPMDRFDEDNTIWNTRGTFFEQYFNMLEVDINLMGRYLYSEGMITNKRTRHDFFLDTQESIMGTTSDDSDSGYESC